MDDKTATTSDEHYPLPILAQAMLDMAKAHSVAIFAVLQRQHESEIIIDLAAPWNSIRHRGNEIRVKTDLRETDEHQRSAISASVTVILTLEDVAGRVAEAMRSLKLNASRSFEKVHKLRVISATVDPATEEDESASQGSAGT